MVCPSDLGKDLCDPEGGVCKRCINGHQMSMGKAFANAQAAYQVLREDTEWTKLGQKPSKRKPLSTFVEKREAIWVSTTDLVKLRSSVPSISVLTGIRTTVYGVTFQPGPSPLLSTRSLLCLCPACCGHGESTHCSFPHMTRHIRSHRFQVNRVKSATVKELQGYLMLQGFEPATFQQLRKPQLVVRVADQLNLTDRSTSADELLQLVTKLMQQGKEREAKPLTVDDAQVTSEFNQSPASSRQGTDPEKPEQKKQADPTPTSKSKQPTQPTQSTLANTKTTTHSPANGESASQKKRAGSSLLSGAPKRSRREAVPYCPVHFPEEGVPKDPCWESCVGLMGKTPGIDQCPRRPTKRKQKNI